MIESAAAITVATSAITKDLLQLFPNLGRYGEIKVINGAPNPLQVQIGADTHWLDSWAADVFCLKSMRQVTFIPTPIQTPAPAAGPTSSLLLSVAEHEGEIPGVFPTAVSRVDAAPQVSLGTISVPQGTTQSTSFSVPAGTHTLGVSLSDVASDWNVLDIIGFDSGEAYYNQVPSTDNQILYWFPLPQVLESKWTVTVSTVAAVGTQTAKVIAVMDTTAVVLAPYGQMPLPVTIHQVVPNLDLDSPKHVPFNVALAASATLDLVAAVAGETVYCIALNIYVVTAAAVLVVLEDDTSPTAIANIRTDVTMAQPRPLFSTPGGVGRKVRLRNTSGATVAGTLAGELIYVQR